MLCLLSFNNRAKIHHVPEDQYRTQKQERMHGGSCFLIQLAAYGRFSLRLVLCPFKYPCSACVCPCMLRLAHTATGKFSQHTLINTYLFLSGLSYSLNLSFSSLCTLSHVLCRVQEGITMYMSASCDLSSLQIIQPRHRNQNYSWKLCLPSY